jgi:ubiquinone/menaquinone biosynthesis C-methylase UbiE
MERTVESVRRAYESEAVAGRYDDARFSSTRARLYVARERHLVRRSLAGFGRISCLLDLPCGTGRYLSVGAEAADAVIGVDAAGAMLVRAAARAAARGAALCVGDAIRLPLAAGAVDVVLCVRFLHLLPRAATLAVLSEIARVARRGAVVATSVGYPLGRVGTLRRHVLRRPPLGELPPSLAEWASRCEEVGLTLASAYRTVPGVSQEAVLALRR